MILNIYIRRVNNESKWDILWLNYEIDIQLNSLWRATVPECDTIRLYFGTDIFAVCGRGDPIFAEGTLDSGVIWNGWVDYFDSGGFGRGSWAVTDLIYVEDPQPVDLPQPPGEVKFDKYLKKDANGVIVVGNDWLPDPTNHDSLIGVVFSCTDEDSIAINRIVYEIFDITTWAGEDMNTPVNPPPPNAIGDSTFFDFHVYNQMYDGEPKYTITTIDEDRWARVKDKKGNWGSQTSTRRYTVERNELVLGDTLWLIARDYAAHAVIMPRGQSTYTLRLRHHVSPFDSLHALWAVTVPRDYDGWQDIGINKGDFIADQWEEDALGVDSSDSAIVNFYPFYNKDTTGAFNVGITADAADIFPAGRNINGDRFTNWEEYRGFHLTGDLDSLHYLQPKHVRLDPMRKNVMVDWREDELEPEVSDNIPGFLDSLCKCADSCLSIRFVETFLNEGDRLNTNRHINLNQQGAYFLYYSVPGVSNKPSDFAQNAITWWRVNDVEKNWICRERGYRGVAYNWYFDGLGYFGACVSSEPDSLGYAIPEYNTRCWVYPDNIRKYKTYTYYDSTATLQWIGDYSDMIKRTISHEFGHAIGMNHIFDNHIMDDPPPIYQTLGLNYGRFFGNTLDVLDYSNSNRKQITIRSKE
jgi:hypothetical protein